MIRRVAATLCACLFLAPLLHAQFQMPDPKQMSGIPRPVDDLPGGSISVRVIRGDLSNNIPNQPVELHVGDSVQTVKTDADGRAQFDRLPAGATVKAVTVVDGERLESQEFPAPGQGGIRLMLVATDQEKEARAKAEASAPAISGSVVLGDQSRVILEPGDEVVEIYYVLTVTNGARAPVNPPVPFTFDMPTGATGTTILEGSSPRATASGAHVRVEGPFPPGDTLVQVGASLPVANGTLDIAQRFPAGLPAFNLVVKKVDNLQLASPQIEHQQDVAQDGAVFVAATGRGVPAGQPLEITLSGLPYHNPVPRWVALGLVCAIALVGTWAAARPGDAGGRREGRQRLIARREKLFQELLRLEREQRGGRGDRHRQAARREELVAALEQIYGALDTEDGSPEPVDRSGLAA
jgi:hypothetical protein